MSTPPTNLFQLKVYAAIQAYLAAQAALTTLVSTRIYRAQAFAAPGSSPAPLDLPHVVFRVVAAELVEPRYGLVQGFYVLFTAQGGSQTAEVDVEKVAGQVFASLQDADITDAAVLCHDVSFNGFQTPTYFDEQERCWRKEVRFKITASEK